MQRLLLILFFLKAINLPAQIDSSLLFYKYKEPLRVGVKQTLYINYDGDNLLMSLEVKGNDTCSFLKGVISDLQQRTSRWYTLGYIYHNSERHILYNSRSPFNLEKKENAVKYFYKFNAIPIVISGLDSIEFRLADYEVDSVVFSYEGKESLEYSKPTALIFAHDTLIWQKQNLIHTEDTLSFKVFFEGPNKGIFTMSRFILQDKDKQLNFNDNLKSLLYVVPFWFLLFILLKHKKVFGANMDLIDQAVKWIAILSGFYFVIFYSEIFYFFDQIEIGMTLTDESNKIVRNRIVFLFASILLFVIQKICFRKNTNSTIIFLKKLFSVIAWSGIALIILCLINLFTESIFSEKQNLVESIKLQVGLNYIPFFGVLGGLFILSCLYKLFSFNKPFMLVACGFFLIFIIMKVVIFFPQLSSPPDVHKTTVSACLRTVFIIEYESLFAIPGIALLAILDKIDNTLPKKETLVFSAKALVFLFCIYGTTALFDHFMCFPITLFCALLLTSYFLLSNLKQKIHFLRIAKPMFELDNLDRKIFTKIFELKQFEKVKEKYRDRLLKGKLLPAEFDKANSDLEDKINESVPMGVDRTMIHRRMQFPLYENNLRNSEHATGYGMVISFLFLLLYFLVFPLNYLKDGSSTDNIFVDFLFYGLLPCFNFIAASFCLGYFFIYIKGDSGWKKGFYLGLVMALARLPFQYLISAKLTFMFFLIPTMREILIMTLIGFFAFDYSTVKKIYGKNFNLKNLAQIEGWQNIVWFASIILSAIGAAITAWIKGNISPILENVIKFK